MLPMGNNRPPKENVREAQDALDWAIEMMGGPVKNVPNLAMEYVKLLSSMYGFCGEVMITALAGYAQKIKGMPCKDQLYQVCGPL